MVTFALAAVKYVVCLLTVAFIAVYNTCTVVFNMHYTENAPN